MNILEISSLSVAYQNVTAVSDINLSVHRGGITGILGSSGAGKSTLMHAISGILLYMKKNEAVRGGQDIRITGKVIYRGEDVTDIKTSNRARQGIILCPERRHIFPESSVLENLKIGGYLASSTAARETMEYVFTIFPELKKLGNRQGGFLSGGEQQMLAVGRALMAQPELLLLDEPFLGLSPQVESRLAKAIKDINQRKGITVLIAEQYARSLFPVIDYGFVMEHGAIVKGGQASGLISSFMDISSED